MCLCHRMASAFRSMGYPLSRNLTLYSFYLTLLLDICRYFPAYKHFEKRKKKSYVQIPKFQSLWPFLLSPLVHPHWMQLCLQTSRTFHVSNSLHLCDQLLPIGRSQAQVWAPSLPFVPAVGSTAPLIRQCKILAHFTNQDALISCFLFGDSWTTLKVKVFFLTCVYAT